MILLYICIPAYLYTCIPVQEEALLDEMDHQFNVKSKSMRMLCVLVTCVLAVAIPNFTIFSDYVGAILTPVSLAACISRRTPYHTL